MGGVMLTSRSQLRAYADAVKVLIRDDNTNTISRAEEIIKKIIKMVLNREPALQGKTNVLHGLRKAIQLERKVGSEQSLGYAKTISDFIDKLVRELQPEELPPRA
jgi:hypothetical protein